jgi:hypothetical protein
MSDAPDGGDAVMIDGAHFARPWRAEEDADLIEQAVIAAMTLPRLERESDLSPEWR